MSNAKKRNLPQKVCPVHVRPFRWRWKWRADRFAVVYRSRRCRSTVKGSGRKTGPG